MITNQNKCQDIYEFYLFILIIKKHKYIYKDENKILASLGEFFGNIIFERRGNNGFGYDPIVKIDELGCTLAELPFEEVCRVGFRAKAAQSLFAKLVQ